MEMIVAFVLALGTILSWLVLPAGEAKAAARAPAGEAVRTSL